jgi:hypothetical protein
MVQIKLVAGASTPASCNYGAGRREQIQVPLSAFQVGATLQRPGAPWTRDRNVIPGDCTFDEEPLAINTEARTRKLGAAVVTRQPVALAVENDIVLREREDRAGRREAMDIFRAAAVFAQQQATARAYADIVG